MFKEFIFNIEIPARKTAPKTSLYVELHTLKNSIHDKRPIIFLIPGGPGTDHRVFKRHSSELKEVARLVYLDPRGCGNSEHGPIESYTMDNLINDIEYIRNILLKQKGEYSHSGFKKISLLGVSYGGMVAQGYAIKHSDFLDKLILVSTVPSFHFIETAKENLKVMGTFEQINVAERLWRGEFETHEQWVEYFSTMKPLYSKHIPANGEPENLLLQKNSMSIDCLNIGFRDFLKTFNHIPNLPKIPSETLIFCGREDFICDHRYSILMANEIPNSHLVIYNCPHAVPIDEHDDYISVTKAFMLGNKLQSKYLVK